MRLVTEEYSNCTFRRGHRSSYEPIYGADGLISKYNFSCIPYDYGHESKSISLGVILGNIIISIYILAHLHHILLAERKLYVSLDDFSKKYKTKCLVVRNHATSIYSVV